MEERADNWRGICSPEKIPGINVVSVWLAKKIFKFLIFPVAVKCKKTGPLKHLKCFKNPEIMRVTGLEQIPDTANAQKKGVSGTSSAVVLNLFAK